MNMKTTEAAVFEPLDENAIEVKIGGKTVGTVIACCDGDWVGDMDLADWFQRKGCWNMKADMSSMESGINHIVSGIACEESKPSKQCCNEGCGQPRYVHRWCRQCYNKRIGPERTEPCFSSADGRKPEGDCEGTAKHFGAVCNECYRMWQQHQSTCTGQKLNKKLAKEIKAKLWAGESNDSIWRWLLEERKVAVVPTLISDIRTGAKWSSVLYPDGSKGALSK